MTVAPIASPQQQASAAQAAADNAASGISTAAGGATGTSSAAQQVSTNALQSLSGNFSDFLHLLMTQLQNQDPTSPLDTNQFTSQLVQFAGVEQQINTNTSLGQLIQLTQGGEMMQGSAMVGKQVVVQSDHIPLQKGSGTVQFTASGPGPVAIAIYSDSGQKIRDVSLTATQGTNTWTWDGTDDNGNSVPDGSYRIAVMGGNADGSTTALPFEVIGTATGVQKAAGGGDMQLELGALSVNFSAVQSVVNE